MQEALRNRIKTVGEAEKVEVPPGVAPGDAAGNAASAGEPTESAKEEGAGVEFGGENECSEEEKPVEDDVVVDGNDVD